MGVARVQQVWTIANGQQWLQWIQEGHCPTAVVQGSMVETWEYEDEDYVLVFGQEVQRRETHSCTGGRSRSACRLGLVSELTTKSTTSPLSPSTGSSIEQRCDKKVHWRERMWTQYIGRVKLVGSCQECFEFGMEWDIGCVQLFG